MSDSQKAVNETVTVEINPRQTSKHIASLAAKGLDNPESLTLEEIRQVCASALGQTETDTANYGPDESDN